MIKFHNTTKDLDKPITAESLLEEIETTNEILSDEELETYRYKRQARTMRQLFYTITITKSTGITLSKAMARLIHKMGWEAVRLYWAPGKDLLILWFWADRQRNAYPRPSDLFSLTPYPNKNATFDELTGMRISARSFIEKHNLFERCQQLGKIRFSVKRPLTRSDRFIIKIK